MNNKASFTFYGLLNDFFSTAGANETAGANRKITYPFSGNPSVKNSIEAMGIPHPEVRAIRVQNQPVLFDYQLKDGDVVDVYCHFDCPVTEKEFLLPSRPNGCPAFILDVHLGVLARYLRLAGFDTLYSPEDWGDEYIANRAGAENRIALSRDIGLLKRSSVVYGYWMRNTEPIAQLTEVNRRFDLKPFFKPFKRCSRCNGLITSVKKEAVSDFVKDDILANYQEFYQCGGCGQIYWKGSHYDNMTAILENV